MIARHFNIHEKRKYAYRLNSANPVIARPVLKLVVAIRPPEALKHSEILTGRWKDCGPPLPVAEEGGTESPQPRNWRAVAQQAREWQCGKVFNGLPHQRDARETRDAIHACRDIGHWFAMTQDGHFHR